MSVYLPPILHNKNLNSKTNSSDFNYQNMYLNYVIGDQRYTKLTDYNNEVSLINTSLSTLTLTDTNLQSQINVINTEITTVNTNIIGIS